MEKLQFQNALILKELYKTVKLCEFALSPTHKIIFLNNLVLQ